MATYYFWVDANDVIWPASQVQANVPPPIGWGDAIGALVPPVTELVWDTTATPSAQDVWNNPRQYLYQNGSIVSNPNWSAQELAHAQKVQTVLINAGLNATLVGGFTSKSTGHTYVTTTNGQTNMEGDLKRFELDSSLTSVQFYTVDAGWIAHTQAQLQSAFLDGGNWKDAQYAQAQTLIGQVEPATTVSAVQAVVWAPASY